MGIFKPGDKITRQTKNLWWVNICKKYNFNPDGVYTVHSCISSALICVEWRHLGFSAVTQNFKLITTSTKEEIIAARIKKLYSKCKTTAHWV